MMENDDMSYLKEQAEWTDGIYQIETSDPVLGGPDGITNRPARELANRTAWLKQQLEEAENALTAHTRSRNHPDASLSEKGFVKLSNANQSSSETEAATPKAVKIVNDRLNAVVDHAPSDLDTLNKLAKAISNNPKFAESVTQLLSQKLAKNENGADIPDKNLFLKNLGLLEMVVPVGVPLPWPAENAPVGWLKCNGDAFDKIACPQLATVYPSGRTPDLRGEFIRGWDNGREVDASRVLLSSQSDDFKVHRHESYFYAGISRHEVPLISLPSSDEMLTLSSTPNSLSPVSIDANGSLIGHDDYNCLEEGNKNNKRTATSLSTNIIGGNETRPRNIAFNYIVRAA